MSRNVLVSPIPPTGRMLTARELALLRRSISPVPRLVLIKPMDGGKAGVIELADYKFPIKLTMKA